MSNPIGLPIGTWLAHMGLDATCKLCSRRVEETTLHCLRSCPKAELNLVSFWMNLGIMGGCHICKLHPLGAFHNGKLLDPFGCAWCDGLLTGCCLAMLSLIFLLPCDRVLALQPLWLSPLCKNKWPVVLWMSILDMITWWIKFIHVDFHP